MTELSSISSYDINQNHLLIRAKAPGTTAEQGLYLFDRATQQFTQIFTLNQTILERNFGFLAELQPGAIATDSSRVVTSLGGSALFVGPFTYIVMLSNEEEDQEPVDRIAGTLTEITTQLSEAKKSLTSMPRKSLSIAKKNAIKAKRTSILDARSSISELLNNLVVQEKESGDLIREQYPNFTPKNLSQLAKLRRTGSSKKVTSKAAKKAWKMFGSLLQKIQGGED